MKFDCGETWEEYKERLSEWHSFFALIPRKVGEHDCRWLEVIERRMTYHPRPTLLHKSFWAVEYRAKEKK